MNNLEQIKQKLSSKNIEFEIINFADEAVSARDKDTSIEKNYNPNNAIKTLVIKSKTGFLAIILKGNQKIDNEKLENFIGKWSIVGSKTLKNIFGFLPGTVCPLVLEIPVLIDKPVMEMSILSMGAGENNKGINVKLESVKNNLDYKEVSITKELNMNTEEKIKLIIRNCQEVLTVEDLKHLIDSEKTINHYIGLEISGMVHLGTGLITMGKIADFIKAGVVCRVFLADFHTFLNNKLGGNWDDIRWASEHYFKEALIASLKCYGLNGDEVEFISGDDLYKSHPEHWQNFMEIGKQITLARNLRSISIMGKKSGTDVNMATLFYPPLQVADIVTMDINLAHAGMDQRKAHVIAREAIKKIPGNHQTPIAIHQNLIAGLTAPEPGSNDNESLKMSKSKPDSAIFVHDTPDEIRNKIKKAYGPPKEILYNPLINWVETLVFWGEETGELKIERPEKFGGNVTYTTIVELKADYASEKLFPLDLKNALSEWLIHKLEPARKHFEITENKQALEKMKELLAKK